MGTVNIRIRELRTALGMTQDSLAKRLGVDRTTISKWEKEDGAEPDSGTIVSLSHIFGVSTDYLLGRTDDPTPLFEESLSPEEYDRRVVAALSRSDGYGEPLTKEEIEDILKYIQWTREKHRMDKERKSDS